MEYWMTGKAVPTKIDRHVLDRDRTGIPKWDENSTNEDVMEWWIK